MEYHIKPSQALALLRNSAVEQSAELLSLGNLSVQFYAPRTPDRQSPHIRDEVYVIASGSATFRCCRKDIIIEQGDVLTVPAGQEHTFVESSPDFAPPPFFYGPEGGERNVGSCCSDEATKASVVDFQGA